MRSASASGPIGWLSPSVDRGVDVLPARESSLVQLDRVVQVGDQEAVHDEAGFVARLDAGLAEHVGAVGPDERHRRVAGGDRGRQLEELHHRRRVEEVHPHDLGGSAARHGELDDGDRGGVGGEHDLIAGHLAEAREDLELGVESLGGGLDHEVDVGQRPEIDRTVDAAQERLGLQGLELAAFDRLADRSLDRRSTRFHQVGRAFDEGDVGARARRHLHDARAHEPAAHDPDPTHV